MLKMCTRRSLSCQGRRWSPTSTALPTTTQRCPWNSQPDGTFMTFEENFNDRGYLTTTGSCALWTVITSCVRHIRNTSSFHHRRQSNSCKAVQNSGAGAGASLSISFRWSNAMIINNRWLPGWDHRNRVKFGIPHMKFHFYSLFLKRPDCSPCSKIYCGSFSGCRFSATFILRTTLPSSDALNPSSASVGHVVSSTRLTSNVSG